MHRLERLYAIVEHLRTGGNRPTPIYELADRFGVGERTVYRDVAALRDQDVPIYGEPGRDGGVWLGGEYSMPPVGLSIGEAIGLWLAFRMSGSISGAAGQSLSDAMAKILATMPDVRRAAYETILRRIIVGVPPSEELLVDGSSGAPEIYRECERAVVESRVLRIIYRDRSGAETERSVEPHGMLV